jgi:hypothetical protein
LHAATAAHAGIPEKFTTAIAQKSLPPYHVFVIEVIMAALDLPLPDRIFLPLRARARKCCDY